MSVYPGLGVNYKAAQANWAADIAYFNAIGLTGIRINLPAIPYPWAVGSTSPGGLAYDRNMAWYFMQQGFYVTWGLAGLLNNGGVTLTSSNWQNWHDIVVAEAQYCQQQGYIFSDFETGNELDIAIDGTTITQTSLIPLLQQLALDVKAVYSGKVSYAISGWGGNHMTSWSGGIGNFDVISVHPYGSTNLATQSISFGTANNIMQLAAQYFGNKWYISEFNLDAGGTFAALPMQTQISAMTSFINTIRNSGASQFMAYSWVGSMNANNLFAFLYTNRTLNPVWYTFFQSNPKPYIPRATTSSRPLTPNRKTP